MNCKPGDLAYVVRDPIEENIGRIVKIVAPARLIFDAPAWDCDVVGDAPMIVTCVHSGGLYLDRIGEFYDADLRPISGAPVQDDVLDEVTA